MSRAFLRKAALYAAFLLHSEYRTERRGLASPTDSGITLVDTFIDYWFTGVSDGTGRLERTI